MSGDGRGAVGEGLAVLAVDDDHDDEEQQVGHGLVELCGVTGQPVALHELEGPGHGGDVADDLRVHQVPQSDEAGGGAGGYGDVVEHLPQRHLLALHIEQQGQYQSQGAAVAGQSLVAGELPLPCVGVGEVYGQQHLYEAAHGGEVVLGLVEDAVPQSGTDEDAEEAVDEQGIELLVRNLLILEQFPNYDVGQCQSDEPAQRVPAEGERAEVECVQRRVPGDVKQ